MIPVEACTGRNRGDTPLAYHAIDIDRHTWHRLTYVFPRLGNSWRIIYIGRVQYISWHISIQRKHTPAPESVSGRCRGAILEWLRERRPLEPLVRTHRAAHFRSILKWTKAIRLPLPLRAFRRPKSMNLLRSAAVWPNSMSQQESTPSRHALSPPEAHQPR